jgi:hypothetical protein
MAGELDFDEHSIFHWFEEFVAKAAKEEASRESEYFRPLVITVIEDVLYLSSSGLPEQRRVCRNVLMRWTRALWIGRKFSPEPI